MENIIWNEIRAIPSKQYTCSYCSNPIASQTGWVGLDSGNRYPITYIYICHFCWRPTFFDISGEQFPDVAFGNPVNDIPDRSIQDLYEEARQATGVGSYTAAVLCCRKLLMHIAVSKGASVGDSFISYVEYLSKNNYIPPDARGWVDHIRKKGNEANHEILIMQKDDAEELMSFMEMLLRVIYEFPAVIKRKIAPSSS